MAELQHDGKCKKWLEKLHDRIFRWDRFLCSSFRITNTRANMDVHNELNRYILCEDLVEAKQLVDERRDTLLSDEVLAYAKKQIQHADPDTDSGKVHIAKCQCLLDCKRMSSAFGFAELLLNYYPDEVSAEVARRLSSMSSPTAIQKYALSDPATLQQVQRIVVGTQLQSALQQELMDNIYAAGDTGRIDVCRIMLRLCDKRIDPETWHMIYGELANALCATDTVSQEARDEAIDIYHALLAGFDDNTPDEIRESTYLNLGQQLILRNSGDNTNDSQQSIHYLLKTLEYRDRGNKPMEWAQSQMLLGQAYLHNANAASQGDKEEIPDESLQTAITCLNNAIEIFHLAKATDLLMKSQELVEYAYSQSASANQSDKDTGIERINPRFTPAQWGYVQCMTAHGKRAEEWIPSGTELTLWNELFTVETYCGACCTNFDGFVEYRMQQLLSRVTDGKFRGERLQQNENEYISTWSIQGDYACADQWAIEKLVRGDSDLFVIRYSHYGVADDDLFQARLSHLRSLTPSNDPAPSPPVSNTASMDEVQGRIAQLASLDTATIDDPLRYCRDMLDGIQRSTHGHLWSSLLTLCGLKLLHRDQYIDTAVDFFRRSLEVLAPGSQPWATTSKALAKALLRQAQFSSTPDIAQAYTAFEKAGEIFIDSNNVAEVSDCLHGLGSALMLTAQQPHEYLKVMDMYLQALELRPRDTDPEGWAESNLGFADACLSAFDVTQDSSFKQQAESQYEKVLSALASQEAFAELDSDTIGRLSSWPIFRLNQLDRHGIEEPVMPEGFKDRETRGKVLFLRPFLTAGSLMLSSQFTGPESFAVQFKTEPDPITLESALYRVLGEHLSFSSIAGRSDGLGATRIFIIGGDGWQSMVLSEFDTAEVIMMIPQDSPGVRWEINTLLERKLLARTLFVMPPECHDFDVQALWEKAGSLMSDLGLILPQWQANGLFFQLSEEGSVKRTLPFQTLWDNTLFENVDEWIL
jgi:tetratricopeptide (TPR) repeat protein